MFKFIKRIRVEHYIYLALSILSIVSMLTLHRAGFFRALQAIRDLGTSIAIWFLSLFDIEGVVTETIMTYDFPEMIKYIGFDFDEFLRKLEELLPTMFTKDSFFAYLTYVSLKLQNWSYILLLLLPVMLIGRLLLTSCYLEPPKPKDQRKWYVKLSSSFKRWLFDHDKSDEYEPIKEASKRGNSKQLKWFLEKMLPKIKDTSEILTSFWKFGDGLWHILLAVIWSVNLNIFTTIVSAFAVYFYFLGTFKLTALFYQLAKLLVDILVMFSAAPFVVWVVVSYVVLDLVRQAIGKKRFQAMEKHNRSFIEELPLSSLVTGWMAAGKTALITDMGISYEAMLRDKALDMIYELDLKFPDFPWRNVEKLVEFGVAFGYIRSLVTVRDYIEEVRQAYNDKLFNNSSDVELCAACFDYNAQSEKAICNNGLIRLNIFDAICDYAQLYLIYHLDTSLIVSSYAVRSGLRRSEDGYFPFYDSDFFARDSYYHVTNVDYMSHVIDYDMFRMGKKVDHRNSNIGIFEFGVCLMSEKGKERGNAVENQCFKKDDISANPKNDLFDLDLKLRRHAATVGFYTFCKFFSDEQRPESVGANEREVSQIIHMNGTHKEGVLLPFFTLTSGLSDWMHDSFKDFYYKYRHVREDDTLFVYLLKHIVSAVSGYVEMRRNVYGYKEIDLKLEGGSEDDAHSRRYVILKKKLFSGRYSTDCLKGVYVDSIRSCKRSLVQLPTYEDIVASPDELKLQNSYFIRDVLQKK